MECLKKTCVCLTMGHHKTFEALKIHKVYNLIDENCILGAMPSKWNYKKIIEKENVKAVLSLCQDFELDFTVPEKKWAKHGVEFLQMPIKDYTGVPDLGEIVKCVDFIKKNTDDNKCVYIHCKAGRYRSALIVACYLMQKHGVKPDIAIQHVIEKRPNAMIEFNHQIKVMEKYYRLVNPYQPYIDINENQTLTKKLSKNIKLMIKLLH